MANLQVVVDNMDAMYQANIDAKTVAFPLVNKMLEASLLEQGDTTKVKYFNDVTLNTVASSGEDITISDWSEQSDDLVVDQVRNRGEKIKDIEEIRSVPSIQAKRVERISKASEIDLDKYTLTTAVANASTVFNSGTPIALDKTNVFAQIELVRVQLSKNDLPTGQHLFVNAHTASMLRQSGLYDAIPEGLNIRQRAAFVTSLSGFMIFETNNLPTADAAANTYMVAFDSEAIYGAEQLNKFKITDGGGKAMADTLLFENVYGMDVLGLNSARVVANKITVQ